MKKFLFSLGNLNLFIVFPSSSKGVFLRLYPFFYSYSIAVFAPFVNTISRKNDKKIKISKREKIPFLRAFTKRRIFLNGQREGFLDEMGRYVRKINKNSHKNLDKREKRMIFRVGASNKGRFFGRRFSIFSRLRRRVAGRFKRAGNVKKSKKHDIRLY